MLAEFRAQCGKPLVDLGEAGLAGRIERGTGTGGLEMIALKHARLLRGQSQLTAAPMESLEPAKQPLIQEDRAPVRGLDRLNLALDRKDRVVALCGREQMENIVDAAQHAARRLKRGDRAL